MSNRTAIGSRSGVIHSSQSSRLLTATSRFFHTSNLPSNLYQIPQGKYTYTVYTLIQQQIYEDAIKVLLFQLQQKFNILDIKSADLKQLSDLDIARSLFSLLAFCYYWHQDFYSASICYEKLIQLAPQHSDYVFYYAASLYKNGDYLNSQRILNRLKAQEWQSEVKKLQLSIQYQLDDLISLQTELEQLPQQEPEKFLLEGFLYYKQMKWDLALDRFKQVYKWQGYKPYLLYVISLCYYAKRDFVPALQALSEIIEKALINYPELKVGQSNLKVKNSNQLQESFLIEAFNLKAAIEYQMENLEGAKEAMKEMPQREEVDLDPVTLHNSAVFEFQQSPADSIDKLTFLLEANPCPQETLQNLILMYIRLKDYDAVASDLMSFYQQDLELLLDPFMKEYFEAVLIRSIDAQESSQKLEQSADAIATRLEQLTKEIKEDKKKQNMDENALQLLFDEYEEGIEKYVPLMMAQANIHWDLGQYSKVEQIFRKSMTLASDKEEWKLNVAHVLFLQENKYQEAIEFYEPIILDLEPIALANLCVSYILTSQNEMAEELMKRVEKEEEVLEAGGHECFHFCTINLVIGTLYCSKGNYEFGISRVIKSLDPVEKKLSLETWYYVKKCLLSLLEIMAKQMLILKDETIDEILLFLEQCQIHGGQIQASNGVDLNERKQQRNWTNEKKRVLKQRTVQQEARWIQCLLLKILENYFFFLFLFFIFFILFIFFYFFFLFLMSQPALLYSSGDEEMNYDSFVEEIEQQTPPPQKRPAQHQQTPPPQNEPSSSKQKMSSEMETNYPLLQNISTFQPKFDPKDLLHQNFFNQFPDEAYHQEPV